MKKSKVRGSFASYKNDKGEAVCDILELANVLKNWGEIPKNINDVKAMEISLLAQYVTRVYKSAFEVAKCTVQSAKSS